MMYHSAVPARRLLGVAVAAATLGLGSLVKRAAYRGTPHVTGTEPPAASSPTLSFRLVDVTREAGLANAHRRLAPHESLKNIAPVIASLAGASAAVVDFDGDGWPDVYLTNAALGSRNRLYRNNRDGSFADVAGKAGLADVNREAGSLRALFFDYDNDGRPDLLLDTTWCPKLFHNDGGGRFTDVTKRSGLDHCGYSHASNVLDFDGDGYLDLVIADYYGPVDVQHPATLKFMFNRIVYADNGGPIIVWRNNRDGTFARVPGNLGLKSVGWTHAVGVYDLRGTGRPDLFFATDFNADQLYLNDGRGGFVDASAAMGKKYSRFGMSAEIGDADNDGRPLIAVSDIYDPGHTPAKNSLWKMRSGAVLDNVAGARGVERCGWSWGAKFMDLDNKGALDLVVANGNLSADRDKDYWFRMETINSGDSRINEDARRWPAVGNASWGGYQKKCVFYNRGGRFEDVSALTALGRDESDGRALAAIDFMNNGSPGLVEANMGQPARLYRNDQLNRNRWLGFDLVGTRSNRDAFGAAVRVTLSNGSVLTREQEPANGYESQSDHRLHFGLGPAPKLEAVEIAWPSGRRQRLAGLALDRYHRIVEPRE